MSSPEAARVKALLAAGMAGCEDARKTLRAALDITTPALAEASGAIRGSANPISYKGVGLIETGRSHGDNALPLLASAMQEAGTYAAGL